MLSKIWRRQAPLLKHPFNEIQLQPLTWFNYTSSHKNSNQFLDFNFINQGALNNVKLDNHHIVHQNNQFSNFINETTFQSQAVLEMFQDDIYKMFLLCHQNHVVVQALYHQCLTKKSRDDKIIKLSNWKHFGHKLIALSWQYYPEKVCLENHNMIKKVLHDLTSPFSFRTSFCKNETFKLSWESKKTIKFTKNLNSGIFISTFGRRCFGNDQ